MHMDHSLPTQTDVAERVARVAGPLIVLVAGIVMTAWTWFKWPDPVVDFGRELYVPWQLSQGKVLYRDIAYFNGPLSPYLNTVVFLLMGVSLRSLVIVNLAILALIIVMIWRLWVIIADALAATLACLLLVTVFAFIQLGDIGNYNFVTPYSHELTHGMAVSLAGMLCIAGYLREPRKKLVVAAGILLGLIFLTKAEVFLAVALSMTTGVALAGRAQRACVLAMFAISALIPPLLGYFLLWSTMPAADAARGTLGSWMYVFDPGISGMKFYRKVFGAHDLANNMHSMIVCLVWWTALFGGIAAVAIALRPAVFRRGWMWLIMLPVMSAVMWFIAHRFEIFWDQAFRGLSLVLLATTAGLLIATMKGIPGASGEDESPNSRRRLVMQLVAALFALLLLGKIFLNVQLLHYGFALAMPATLVMTALLASWWPNFIDRRGGSGLILRSAAIAAVGLVIYIYLDYYRLLAADKQVLVGAGGNAFRADALARDKSGKTFDRDHRGRAVQLAIETLGSLPANATLVTVPEGIMINYLSRRVNPTPYINLMPPEVLMFGQQRILRALEQNPPDYILLVLGSDPSDFGYKSFAADYGRQIYDWIREHYREIPSPREPTYPLVLLEKKP